MTDKDKQRIEVFEQLKQFITEIIGKEIAEEIEISKESIFTKDLEMDSIEIVAFAEKVKNKYGKEYDFVNWLSGMQLEQILSLSINDVIEFMVNGNTSN